MRTLRRRCDSYHVVDATLILRFLSFFNGDRAVQLGAGAIGGRMYLAAYAQHLGATGLTFFDDDVTNFFSPRGKDKSAMFLLAIGKPVKRTPQWEF